MNIERPITPRREMMNKKTNIEQRVVIEEKDDEERVVVVCEIPPFTRPEVRWHI